VGHPPFLWDRRPSVFWILVLIPFLHFRYHYGGIASRPLHLTCRFDGSGKETNGWNRLGCPRQLIYIRNSNGYVDELSGILDSFNIQSGYRNIECRWARCWKDGRQAYLSPPVYHPVLGSASQAIEIHSGFICVDKDFCNRTFSRIFEWYFKGIGRCVEGRSANHDVAAMFPREIPPRLEERGSVVDECCCRNDNPYHNLNSGKWASRSPTPTQGGLLALAGRDHSLRIYSHPQPQKIECSPFRFNFNRTHSTRRVMPGAPFMRVFCGGWPTHLPIWVPHPSLRLRGPRRAVLAR